MPHMTERVVRGLAAALLAAALAACRGGYSVGSPPPDHPANLAAPSAPLPRSSTLDLRHAEPVVPAAGGPPAAKHHHERVDPLPPGGNGGQP